MLPESSPESLDYTTYCIVLAEQEMKQRHSDACASCIGLGESSNQNPAAISKLRNLYNMQWRVAGSMGI
jgi:hypothetical protein